MIDAAQRIRRLQRSVMLRSRLLSLRDAVSFALTLAFLIIAPLIVVAKLRLVEFPLWTVIAIICFASIGVALVRWATRLATEDESAVLIDQSLKLDDRITSSLSVISRGGPSDEFQRALIEDAAERVSNERARSIVRFGMPRSYAVSLLSVVLLVGAAMLPARAIPVTEAAATERTDVDNAGVRLEESSSEIERESPKDTDTAALAREQADLGRKLRALRATRAEALKRLGALEERIRQRHDDLANTHADEIVTLADRRFSGTISSTPLTPKKFEQASLESESRGQVDSSKPGASQVQQQKNDKPGNFASNQSVAQPSNSVNSSSIAKASQSKTKSMNPRRSVKSKLTKVTAPASADGRTDNSNKSEVSGDKQGSTKPAANDHSSPGETAAKSSGGNSAPKSEAQAGKPDPAAQSDDKKPDAEHDEAKTDDAVKPAVDALKAVPDSLSNQAAKALPRISAELLKKAAQLRDKQLTPSDIEKLRNAAESLSKDLAKIGQSEELQKALKEMAREVKPEQVEEVARQLESQENLKKELEGAARLLSENRQARETVAGLAGQFARERNQGGDNPATGQRARTKADGSGGNDTSANSRTDSVAKPKSGDDTRLREETGQGRKAIVGGKLQQRPGGEYLYLQTKAGTGSSRVEYSSAYPQYRREAERSISRSQVPPGMRSVVRKYFDAINPEAKK
jgi:hypothetical protein